VSPGDPPAETADPSLQHDIDALALPGLSIGHRLISPGDEHALLDAEAASIASSVAAVRRASGAARIVARRLLAPFGYAGFALRRGASGEPLWPAGITGSLAHDDTVAVAAVGRQSDVGAVGIDIEPAVPLSRDMLALVATPEELRRIADVAEKYEIPMIKLTGGQRIDLLGVRKEDLPAVWSDLDMPSVSTQNWMYVASDHPA